MPSRPRCLLSFVHLKKCQRSKLTCCGLFNIYRLLWKLEIDKKRQKESKTHLDMLFLFPIYTQILHRLRYIGQPGLYSTFIYFMLIHSVLNTNHSHWRHSLKSSLLSDDHLTPMFRVDKIEQSDDPLMVRWDITQRVRWSLMFRLNIKQLSDDPWCFGWT
jgi:hypothetical protein